MKKCIFIIILIFFVSLAYARDFGDVSSNKAKHIKTDTSLFQGNLGASDTTVQNALQTLSAMTQSDVSCETTDDWCFTYDSTNEQLSLYVNNVEQAIWPQTAAVSGIDILLLESGDGLLLENDVDSILLE